MLPRKGFNYKCKISFNQYIKDKIYKCHKDGYLEVSDGNYRIQDESFFDGYFEIQTYKIDTLLTFSKNLTKDKIVLQVMEDLNDRSRVGIEKYNTTLERTDLELKD